MDYIIQNQIDQLIAELKQNGHKLNDPVQRLIISSLVFQVQKIKDLIESIPEKVTSRLCSYFIPPDKVSAIPALCLVQPTLRRHKDLVPKTINDGTSFTYKLGAKQILSYYPLFANLVIPYDKLHIVAPHIFKSDGQQIVVKNGKKGQVWLGMEMNVEVDSLTHVSFLIKGVGGLLPQRISVANDSVELAFSAAAQMEDLPVLEPFDAQQSQHSFFETLSTWKNVLASADDWRLIYITDKLIDRDAFKCNALPFSRAFHQSLESRDLDTFKDNTLWLLFDFGNQYDVPDTIDIVPNVVPVVNVGVNSVTLTQSSPIAKLAKDDGSYFLKVIETSSASVKQGFSKIDNEVVIRDFDAHSYNGDLLYKDIRNLYYRFVEDYYAFIDYHGLKDGELIRSLREIVNRIAKNTVQHESNKYEDGVFAMRNINAENLSSSIKVSYMTTSGRLGNSPKAGEMMENKKDSAIEKNVAIITDAQAGEDKANADMQYELLRYYTLTADRLYTKMDLDAFVRMQLLKEYGHEEFKRISYTISIQGAGGKEKLRRGLYIDISFKDRKNYQKALSLALDKKLYQLIMCKSCISMPIIINLINAESKL